MIPTGGLNVLSLQWWTFYCCLSYDVWETFFSLLMYSYNIEWMNEWTNKESWMRGQQTCPLTIHFKMWTVSSDVNIQRRRWQLLSVHLWAYCTHPTHDANDVMCEGWPQHRGLRLLLFSNSGVGSFTSQKNQISVSAVRQDLRFFVLMRED